MAEKTNHENLQDEVIPEKEERKPEISPFISSRMQTDRARDLQAQASGQISRLYDLGGEAPVPEGGVSALAPLEGMPKAIPTEKPDQINRRLLEQTGEKLESGKYEYGSAK